MVCPRNKVCFIVLFCFIPSLMTSDHELMIYWVSDFRVRIAREHWKVLQQLSKELKH